ncbi:MAG: orotidine-5'-phosphate decarboxylase [Candidatus Omnitrophica bacterium]|nr:orotidine-5'-phosphate decarboxylase [Candidatus Omnitrophota bacterium]MDD5081280.1 orotidine-5'-phosphate decarboxylase [Candidatus Omnitrophota bacterium]MDD5441082.1 orotidine-5'-phosphate decarboxylase [Candidatus Omnitrophota bacterium]
MKNNKLNKVIVSLDITDKRKINSVVKDLTKYGVRYKIGAIPFVKFGPKYVAKLIDMGADVFVDLKLYDIPNTMAKTAAVITEMGAWAFTVHVKAGNKALTLVSKEVKTVANRLKKRKPLVLGVTELTSNDADINDVMQLVRQAADCGLDGVISSPWEAAGIKSFCKKNKKRLYVVTPGIRCAGDAAGDQKRVATASFAFKEGADYIVVGRSIIDKPDYVQAAMALLK